MNTYIQDKLDEIEDDLKEKGYTKHERETVIGILEQSLTDYHNHIVEIIDNISPLNSNNAIDHHIKIKSILQDTNKDNV